MPRLFKGLLISCKRNFEQNAASEIMYILSNELGYTSGIQAKKTSISGLITVGIKDHDILEIVDKLIKLEDDGNYYIHCLKIKPILKVFDTDLDKVKEYITENLDKIEGDYKVEVGKRHSPLRSQEVIYAIAPLIENSVNLSNPKTLVSLEILGDKLGISIISPNKIYSTRKVKEDSKEADNWFLS